MTSENGGSEGFMVGWVKTEPTEMGIRISADLSHMRAQVEFDPREITPDNLLALVDHFPAMVREAIEQMANDLIGNPDKPGEGD